MKKNLNQLLAQLIKLHPKYIDLSLDRLAKLLSKIGNPELKLPPVIHIAGTNGKGSTLSYIRNILEENQFKVHAYISPHLHNFNERIIIGNKEIKTKKLLETLKFIKKLNNNQPITFFEITTAAALLLFSQSKADFLILETGLGGRLDATNIIKKSLIDIITTIGKDHQEFLGTSIKKIANEKLGIIKPGSSVVIGKQNKIIQEHIESKLKNKKNYLLIYNRDFKVIKKNKNIFTIKYQNKTINISKPRLRGDHQIINASTAICAILRLNELGYSFSKKIINKGIKKTFWPGRLELKKLNNYSVYLDGAHNIDGALQIKKYFNDQKIKIWVVIGMLKNKNIKAFLKILKPITLGVIAIPIPGEINCFTSSEIKKVCNVLKINSIEAQSIKEANKKLIHNLKSKTILVTGSLYLVGKVRKNYL
ncbi:bifunctional folylpolyglutamate synthase/dihydrofolate synthase [Alphaproteobacteria bacterium]|nr:bifunctional folylpolyglutamate synthase/dihydrofolate synthase [Alphaproteobacteria bacterium]